VTATVAFLNQKGGVGKTTVTLGLASAAMAAGDRVLVIDLDPQANASWILGVDAAVAEVTTADLLAASKTTGPGRAGKAVVGTGWGPAVDLVPSSGKLLELEGSHSPDTAVRLRKALAHIRDDYELVLVDCAPSLGWVTTTGLAAADLAVMVVEPSALSLRGIEAVADTIESVWEKLNPTLDLAGVIVNRVPGVSAEADRRLEELGRIVGRRSIWQPVVPQGVILNQAAAERAPIHAFGARAHDVADVFDQLYRKLKRTGRKRSAGPA
jgi:chromosome partitioning protein